MSFEESLLTSAKHLDGVEMTPKSFVYSSSSATPAALPTGNRKASTAAKPTQPSSSSLTLPAQSNAVIESRLSAGGASIAPTQGPRGRFSFPLDAAISSPVASIASPNQKGNPVSVSAALVSSSISGIALESFPSSYKMSRSGSDSQLPHNSNQSHVKSASSHSPPSYLGGGASFLPLSISNPLDSLEMLGASLDLHQEEMEGNGHAHAQVDGHGNGYEEEEEGDEAQEEGAERESIGMSSKPFRVNHCNIHSLTD